MLGLPVEDIIRTGGVPGVVTARVVRTEQHPDAAQDRSGSGSTPATARTPRLVRGVQLRARRRRAAGLARHGDARRPHDRPARHPRHRLRGHALLGARARPRRRPQRHPRAGRRQPARRALRRRALGLRDDVVLDVDVTRNRPDCWSYIGVARDLAAKLGVAFTPPTPPEPKVVDERPVTTVEIVDGDRCGRFTSTVHRRRGRRPVGAVDGRAPDRGRHAPDQQRRRRQQLRDARARPAQPRLRPGDAGRRRLPHPPGPRR